MRLKKLLRSDFENNIRSKLIKDRCEYCGDINNLHLHHVDMFKDLMKETLSELNLKELDTKEYNDSELTIIRDVMLGKQIKIKYITLCDKCHKKLHSNDESVKNYYNPYGKYIQINIDEMKKLNLEGSILFKFLYLCTNIDYDNSIMYDVRVRNKRYADKFKDLQELLNLKDKQFYDFKRIIYSKDLIKEENNKLYISSKYVVKGYNNYKSSYKIFIDNFKNLYYKCSTKQHKIIGNIFIGMFDDMTDNIINKKIGHFIKDIGYKGKPSNFIERLNCITDDFIKSYNKQLYINPKYLITGIVDERVKLLEYNFEQAYINS